MKAVRRAMSNIGQLVPLSAISICVLLLMWWYLPLIWSDDINSGPVISRVTPANINWQPSSERPSFNNRTCSDIFPINMDIVRKYETHKQEGLISNVSNATQVHNILILTPISDSAATLDQYFSLLCSLSYPHASISVALGEDSSTDDSFQKAVTYSERLQGQFKDISVHKLEKGPDIGPKDGRHSKHLQLKRRQHLAISRNQLLFRAMKAEYDWVLWIDSDVVYYPPNIMQLLLSAEEDIVAPACLAEMSDSNFIIYDKNTWKDTPASLEFLAKHNPEFLMLEGYGSTKRKYLSHLRDSKKVEIDGVGGCTLLVRASSHRSGLIFPTFVFDQHIETEGLAKMAKKMGYSVYGMPFVSVFHA